MQELSNKFWLPNFCTPNILRRNPTIGNSSNSAFTSPNKRVEKQEEIEDDENLEINHGNESTSSNND